MTFDTPESLLLRLPVPPYTDESTSELFKLMDVFATGLWQPIKQTMDDVRRESYIQTATGVYLDRHANTVKLLREADESDASLRLRIFGEIRSRRGGTTRGEILDAIAGFLQTDASNITMVENMDPNTDEHRPAYYYIQFPTDLLADLGFAPADYTDVINKINVILDRLSAAGVKGEVVTTGGAEFDVDEFDDPESLFG